MQTTSTRRRSGRRRSRAVGALWSSPSETGPGRTLREGREAGPWRARAHVNATNRLGQSVLLIQCRWGRSCNVELLLADPRVDLNLADVVKGDSSLHYAAVFGHSWYEDGFSSPMGGSEHSQLSWLHAPNRGFDQCVVEQLLADPRVDANKTQPETQNTPLNSAVNRGARPLRQGAPRLASSRPEPCRCRRGHAVEHGCKPGHAAQRQAPPRGPARQCEPGQRCRIITFVCCGESGRGGSGASRSSLPTRAWTCAGLP